MLLVCVVAQIGPIEADNFCGGSETLAGEEPMFARLEVGRNKSFALGLKGLERDADPRSFSAYRGVLHTKRAPDKLEPIAREPM